MPRGRVTPPPPSDRRRVTPPPPPPTDRRVLRSHAHIPQAEPSQAAQLSPQWGHQDRGDIHPSESSSLSSIHSSLSPSLPPSLPPSRSSQRSSAGDDSVQQNLAAQYTLSIINKARLKCCIYIHFFLTFAMLVKLAPYILDQFDVFIPTLEELELPKPCPWEWIWLLSLVANGLALDGIKKDSVQRMKHYMIGIGLLGIMPLLYAFFYWLPEVIIYLVLDYNDPNYDYANDYLYFLDYWKGYPCGLLWFVFITAAIPGHVFAIYFSYKLIQAWKARGIPQE